MLADFGVDVIQAAVTNFYVIFVEHFMELVVVGEVLVEEF